MLELITRDTARKYAVNKSALLAENDISFYLLGAYMSDGNISIKPRSKYFKICANDGDWISLIRDKICPDKPIYNESACSTLQVNDIECINWLVSYGCTPNKSYNLNLEKPIPEEYQRDFIRGVLDGDGSISRCQYVKKKNGKEYHYMKNTVYICSVSKKFIESLQEMVPKDINYNIIQFRPKDSMIKGRAIKATCDMYRLHFNDSNAKKFLSWVYYPGHNLSMPRKSELASKIILSINNKPETNI